MDLRRTLRTALDWALEDAVVGVFLIFAIRIVAVALALAAVGLALRLLELVFNR